ncbi:alpha/beta fold hydrolase [Aquibacillus halophilus]|uniref:Alpha/beta fold hydrolase n=1 Tax=Aquibacillus halophilus TaxID=930132 RepID=A0A6A8DD79_9BACI|nr:alpha/beta fold hydrolase [Aquibacillus halophilus]MRH43638.1 alpha/beta fold hydrolase [Aquibacillus halophilus]
MVVGCLCIHGFTGGAYELDPLANYLRNYTDWQVEVPTLPGHGEVLNLNEVTFRQWIDQAEVALMKLKKKCDKIYLIGFSMGGMIASYLAAKHNVAKLVLLSTSRKYISWTQMTMDIGRFVRMGFSGELNDDPLFKRYMSKRGAVPVKAMIEFLKCMKFTKPYIKRVKCPVLIAQGIQDGMVPYKTAVYLDKEIPTDTKVIFFNDSKHHICLGSDKDVLIDRVNLFLLQ